MDAHSSIPSPGLCIPRGTPGSVIHLHHNTLEARHAWWLTPVIPAPGRPRLEGVGVWPVWATGWFQAILRYGVRSCLTRMTPPCAGPSLGLVSILVQVVRYALTEQEILQTARSDGMFPAQTCWDKKWKWKEGGKQASKSEITERLTLFCWKVEYGNFPNTRKTLKLSPLMLTRFRV